MVVALLLSLHGQVVLPGTQPNELALPPEPSSTCGCHDTFTSTAVTEPGESHRATMMALSARDPIFRAALQVSFDDRPELTDLCLRCHAPIGWLSGRSTPGDGSLLQFEDLESVTCDMCHRQVRSTPQLIGDGQYTLDTSTSKRARRGARPVGGHNVIVDDFVASSEMCGTCHSLFNPAENAHDPSGQDLGSFYYEQRTYEEWRDSAFPAKPMTCIDCHIGRTRGSAVRGGSEYADLAVHSYVGGNIFAVEGSNLLFPNLAISALIPEIRLWVDRSLRSAAALAITSPSSVDVESGGEYTVSVRLTNLTGHKLPTGYPEGRRVYLEVTLDLGTEPTAFLSGEWDRTTGDVVRDPQLRTYETQHGRVENGQSSRTHHLILMNQVLLDTRIPPEGFDPSAPDMVPAGRDYGSTAPYRNYDEHTYTFTAPDVAADTTGTITVRALYQVTDGEVMRFLMEANAGRQEATNLETIWEALDHAPPQEMAVATLPITVREPPPPPPDAGSTPEADAGGRTFEIGDGGCACSGGPGLALPWLALPILLRALSPARGSRDRRSAGGARPGSRRPPPR